MFFFGAPIVLKLRQSGNIVLRHINRVYHGHGNTVKHYFNSEFNFLCDLDVAMGVAKTAAGSF